MYVYTVGVGHIYMSCVAYICSGLALVVFDYDGKRWMYLIWSVKVEMSRFVWCIDGSTACIEDKVCG
jgi:hypothetical protein